MSASMRDRAPTGRNDTITGEGLVLAALLVGGAWCVHAVRNAA
jgi:hypothetical protein